MAIKHINLAERRYLNSSSTVFAIMIIKYKKINNKKKEPFCKYLTYNGRFFL